MVTRLFRPAIATFLSFLFAGPLHAAGTINPYPRQVISQRTVAEWNFADSGEGWRIAGDTTGATFDGSATFTSTGNDPMFLSPAVVVDGIAVLTIRMKTDAAGPGRIFWSGEGAPGFSEDFAGDFATKGDGAWHDYHVTCPYPVAVRHIRIDPATASGRIEIESIRLEELQPHPLEIAALEVRERNIAITVFNHDSSPRVAESGNQSVTIPPGKSDELFISRTPGLEAIESLEVAVSSEQLPTLTRKVIAINPHETTNWLWLSSPEVSLLVAPDGTGAKLLRYDGTVAWFAPFALRDDEPVRWKRDENAGRGRFVFRNGKKERLSISLRRNRIRISLSSPDELEGPVIRVPGRTEQSLLAGVEHLGKGEHSSSTLDLRGPEHIRHTPHPRLLTMPLMATVTSEASLALGWKKHDLQPVFATPNFFDGSPDTRFALRGKRIDAEIFVGTGFDEGGRLEDAVLWSATRGGELPALPAAPRSHEEQLDLCLQTLRGDAIRDPESGGWFHAILPGVKSLPAQPKIFADHLSTIFRLTGEVPDVQEIAPAGGHLRNPSIYFVTGRAENWLQKIRGEAASLVKRQQPDGSFRYGGKFREGHFEDTSSGQNARPAARLLEIAKWTGDAEARAAGLKTLEFMKRFRTPRGAQVWECPLHAPDIMASAFAVKAYVLGFELTGDEEYRSLARHWALSGVPFVYQWSDRPTMLYATTATLCATKWQAPVWIGRPVQWCGLVYADALLDLAPFDETLDWRKLAEGILISGEQQQYTEGPSAGLLADSITLENQQLHPYDINPTALVQLRLRLHEQPAALEFAFDETSGRRIVSPFPLSLEGNTAVIAAPEGLRYEVVVDGQRVVEIESKGRDVVALDPSS